MNKKVCEDNIKFGLKVKFERLKRNLTQEKLAEFAGISVNSVSMIERGITSPTLQTVKALSKAFDIPLEDLVKTVINLD